MTSFRPTKRLRPMIAPSGIPITVLNSSAVPDTRSERMMISNRAGSRVTMRRMASARPRRISSMVASYLTWISTTPLTWTLPGKPGATMLKPPWLRKETIQSAQASTSARAASAL